MICIGSGDGLHDSCQGDSGGPALYFDGQQWLQAGIISWGEGCAVEGLYGVYTRLADYIPWIHATINQLHVSGEDFGVIEILGFLEKPVILLNQSQETMTIQSLRLSQIGDFELVRTDCTQQPLLAGEQCEAVVRFQPQAPGDAVSALQLSAVIGTQSRSLEVSLQGTALADADATFAAAVGSSLAWFADTQTWWVKEDSDFEQGSALQGAGSEYDPAQLLVTMEGAGTLTFSYAASEFDFISVWLDGELQFIANNTGTTWLGNPSRFATVSLPLDKGEHRVLFQHVLSVDGLLEDEGFALIDAVQFEYNSSSELQPIIEGAEPNPSNTRQAKKRSSIGSVTPMAGWFVFLLLMLRHTFIRPMRFHSEAFSV